MVNTMTTIRVILPQPLRTIAGTGREIEVEVAGPVTQRSVLDAVEAAYPVLRGTMRDHVTKQRRPLMRFFGCGQDLSLAPPDDPLPQPIASGEQPFMVVGAIAGG
jgi:sulfur-carrier protein